MLSIFFNYGKIATMYCLQAGISSTGFPYIFKFMICVFYNFATSCKSLTKFDYICKIFSAGTTVKLVGKLIIWLNDISNNYTVYKLSSRLCKKSKILSIF